MHTAKITIRVQEATNQISGHCQNHLNCHWPGHPFFFHPLTRTRSGIFVLRWICSFSSVVHMKSNVLITWGINLHPSLHYFYLVFLVNQVTQSIHTNLQIFQSGAAELGKSITYWHSGTKNRDLHRALEEETFLQMEKLRHRVKVSPVKKTREENKHFKCLLMHSALFPCSLFPALAFGCPKIARALITHC